MLPPLLPFFFFSSRFSCSGFLWCALFFSLNIIIPPRKAKKKRHRRFLLPSLLCTQPSGASENQAPGNFYPIFPSSSFLLMFLFHPLSLTHPTISAVFISILLLFNQLLILSAVHTTFCFFFPLFRRRNHSPIFILSSFVCEQRPQKVALGAPFACRLYFSSTVSAFLDDFNGFSSVKKRLKRMKVKQKRQTENFLA